MKKINIIGICLISVVVLILASSSNAVGYQTIESTNQIKTHKETNDNSIIMVDDEPGDAGYTSIKEAVNASNPGDTIEVFSGTYYEEGIRIVKNNITLLGIAHELGAGNDSGKPCIQGDGTVTIIKIVASYVTVENFQIEDFSTTGGNSCIQVGAYWPDPLDMISMSGCIVSECSISNSSIGILGGHWGHLDDTTIINNTVSHCTAYGIYAEAVYNPVVYTIEGDFYISGNVITDCQNGIYFLGDWQNISRNKVKRCIIGIQFRGAKNIIYGNDLESCSVGVHDNFIIPRINGEPVGSISNLITKNNFKNYTRGKIWWNKPPSFFIIIQSLFRDAGWKENYWDTWRGSGPKFIPGVFIFGETMILPWCTFDWKPAKDPFEIS